MADRNEILKQHRDHVFFSWAAQEKVTNPIVVDHAKGIYFWDVDGKRFIDFSSQLMNMNIGHGHPKVLAAINEQAEKLAFAYPGTAHEAKGECAAKLAEITPGDLTKVLFTLGGAEAVGVYVLQLSLFPYFSRHWITPCAASGATAHISGKLVLAGGDDQLEQGSDLARPILGRRIDITLLTHKGQETIECAVFHAQTAHQSKTIFHQRFGLDIS